jgi:hypothetical protein
MGLSNTCAELLEVIDDLEQTVNKQNKLIRRLVNENTEKENVINELAILPY